MDAKFIKKNIMLSQNVWESIFSVNENQTDIRNLHKAMNDELECSKEKLQGAFLGQVKNAGPCTDVQLAKIYLESTQDIRATIEWSSNLVKARQQMEEKEESERKYREDIRSIVAMKKRRNLARGRAKNHMRTKSSEDVQAENEGFITNSSPQM